MATSIPRTTGSRSRSSDRAAAARRRGNLRQGVLVPYLMLGPAIVLFALFMAAPILYTVLLSFEKTVVSGLGLGTGSRSVVFGGLSNYSRALGDAAFVSSVGRVLLYAVILIPVALGLATLFALLLDTNRARAVRFSRITIFLPYAVPGVISSLLWGFLYLPAVSPITYLLRAFGIDSLNILGPHLVLLAVANIGLWSGVGFNMIVIYTALRAIPTDLYEAARLDGASEMQIAWRIKIPLVMPSLIMTALFSIIAVLQVFTEPTTLQPLTNSISSSWTPLMAVYRDAFINNDNSTAAAMSVLIAAATFIFSFAFLRIVQRRAFGQED